MTAQSAAPYGLPRVTIDFETRSELDVRDVGAWRYAEHPSTEILVLSFRYSYSLHGTGARPTFRWVPGEDFPKHLIEHIRSGGAVEAHNAQFEQAVWYHKLCQNGIPMPTKWLDTQAVCAYRALPLSLDQAGEALGLQTQKDKRGKYLLSQLSSPRKLRKDEKKAFDELKNQGIFDEDAPYPVKYRNDPDLLEELYRYCDQDVLAEESLSHTLGELPKSEYYVWTMDQKINNRGIQVDLDAVNKALNLIVTYKEKLTKELKELTDGELDSIDKLAKVQQWLSRRGCDMPNMQAHTVSEELKRKDLSPPVRRVLQIRAELSKASTKKLIKLRDCACHDGRVRGLLQYHGTSTGRWAGRLVQPQNFPRGDEKITKDMDTLFSVIKSGDLDLLEMLYDSPMDALASSLRGMFIAGPGKILRVADFSAIEACVLAWVAGEEWKLEAFRTIQKGKKYEGADDIYCATASKIFGRTVTKKENPEDRQIGKICELAFGYEGGVGAWVQFDKSGTRSEEEIQNYKNEWRGRHPNIKAFWRGVNEACIEAVKNPGFQFSYSCVTFAVIGDEAGRWLICRLPNGRCLWFYDPMLEEYQGFRGKEYKVTYMSRDSQKGGRWRRTDTYGGKLTENIVQAISRDLMVEAMIRCERAGYPIILTVHDEIVAETDDTYGSQQEFEQLMAYVPPWAQGCPVGVAGWSDYRYKKD